MKAAFLWLWPWSKQSRRVGNDATAASMNSGRNNFETSVDDNRFRSSQISDLGQIGSNIQMPLPVEGVNRNQQLHIMPALLRLNSIGEVSCVHHSEDSPVNRGRKERGVTSTGLHFSAANSLPLPADSLISPRTKQSIFQRMASVKALSPNKSRYSGQSTPASTFMKSFSLPEHMAKSPQPGLNSRMVNSWGRRPNLSSSLDSCWGTLSKSTSGLSGCLPRNCVSMDGYSAPCLCQTDCCGGSAASSSQTRALDTSVCGNVNGFITSAVKKLPPGLVESAVLSAVTATYTHSTQPHGHSTTSVMPSQSVQDSYAGKDSIPFSSSELCKLPTMQAAKENLCDTSKSLPVTATPVLPLASTSCVASDTTADSLCPDFSIIDSNTGESDKSLKASPLSSSGDHLCQSSLDSCSVEENTSDMDGINKCEEDKKSSFSNSDGTSPCRLKHLVSLTSVLFSPRKTVKKGRPSSKKQKKRQREKRKHASQPTSEDKENSDSHSACGSGPHQQASLSQDSNNTFSMSDSENDSFDCSSDSSHSHPKQSTPVKAQSKHPAIACFVTAPRSDSEETDNDDEDNEDSSDWSADEGSGACISPIKGGGFNVALSLDSIFKQKNIPSLKSVLSADDSGSDTEPSTSSPSAKKNGLCLTLSLSLSEEEDSVEFSASPRSSTSSECALFGFTSGLSIDALFSKKPTSSCNNQKSTRLKNSTSLDFDHLGGHSLEESSEFDDSSLDHCSMPGGHEMKEINARWDRDYPTAGFRTCCSTSSDFVEGPNIKVRFATEPHLRTVYEVGAEERGGTWHHFALDRERFERRIRDVSEVLLPVLQQDHRARVLERNLHLEQQMK